MTSEPLNTPSAEFERRFHTLEALVAADDATFNPSKTFSELVVLQKLARTLGDESREHALVLGLMALVQSRREDFEDTLELGSRSLEIQARVGPLPGAFELRHLLVTSAEALGLHEEAVGHLKLLVRLADDEGSLTPRQRLGLRQHLGALLHEVEHFEEAREVNLAMLRDAERTLGPTDIGLTGVLGNLAQNVYELGFADEAADFLERRLELADANEKADIAIDSVFQLAALAFEAGDFETARRHFEDRLTRARKTGDPAVIEAAEADLAEYQRRLPRA